MLCDAARRATLPAPRVESIVDCTLGWTSPVGMIPAPCVRAMAPPNARLPTFETNSWSGPAAILGGLGLVLWRPRLLVFVDALGIAHDAEDTGARVSRRKGRLGVRSGAIYPRLAGCVTSATGNQRRASVLEILGAWLHVWTPPRDVEIPPVPWRKLAIWAGVGAVVLGVALAVMIPRINEGKDERAAAEPPPSRRARTRPTASA